MLFEVQKLVREASRSNYCVPACSESVSVSGLVGQSAEEARKEKDGGLSRFVVQDEKMLKPR